MTQDKPTIEKLIEYFEQQKRLQDDPMFIGSGREAYQDAIDVCQNFAASLNRQGCRWTKASERLSQHYVNMCCRLIGEEFYFTAYYDYSKQLYIPRNFSGSGYLKPEEIEYLDESIEPCATSSESGFAEWVIKEYQPNFAIIKRLKTQ